MLASSLFLTSNNSNKDGSSAADAESSPHSLLSALFGWWPDDFVHRLVQMSAGGPATADGGYAGPTLHFGEREYVVVGFWKIGSGLGTPPPSPPLSGYRLKSGNLLIETQILWLAASMLVVALIAVLHEAIYKNSSKFQI
ncbi:hypothetical protein niasHT_037027 [Heterodera trifolii]|uniref:Uncharacterized protein n=1 Tax=Heterodera trifolii TaxID=157864 RepID=A0ABD2ISL5_9BILA